MRGIDRNGGGKEGRGWGTPIPAHYSGGFALQDLSIKVQLIQDKEGEG